MKRGTLAFGAATALLVAMGYSNPDVEQHQIKLTNVLTNIANAGEEDGLFAKESAAYAITDPVAQKQTEIVTRTLQHVSSTFIETGVRTTLKVTDYLLCSVGEICTDNASSDGDNGRLATIGVCGHVFTMDPQNILNSLVDE